MTPLRTLAVLAFVSSSFAVVGCAADASPGDEGDDVENVASEDDAPVGSETSGLHRPRVGSAEYEAILGALDANYEARIPRDQDVRLPNPSRLRVAKGWAFVVVTPELSMNGKRIYTDGDLYALLRFSSAA